MISDKAKRITRVTLLGALTATAVVAVGLPAQASTAATSAAPPPSAAKSISLTINNNTSDGLSFGTVEGKNVTISPHEATRFVMPNINGVDFTLYAGLTPPPKAPYSTQVDAADDDSQVVKLINGNDLTVAKGQTAFHYFADARGWKQLAITNVGVESGQVQKLDVQVISL